MLHHALSMKFSSLRIGQFTSLSGLDELSIRQATSEGEGHALRQLVLVKRAHLL